MPLVPAPRKTRATPGRLSITDCTLAVQIDPQAVVYAQGYRITVTPEGVSLVSHDPAGAFYAQQTWQQLTRNASPRWGGDGTIACGEIEDWPDFLTRGVMLDISRDKVPTMASLFALVDQLSHHKINQLQLYTEHTFAYEGHECAWEQASPMTPQQVRELDAYCADRFVELVPNQNCFGHFERWLKHEPYQRLSERPIFQDGDDAPIFYRGRVERGEMGHAVGMGSTLCPVEPGSITLVKDLLSQLLPCFTSSTVNVGGDETFDMGFGRSREACKNKGKGRVYLEYLQELHRLCTEQGKTMQFWGDMAWHHPELLPEVAKTLPNAVALNWGYENYQTFEKEAKLCADAGVPFFVCPSTASFNTLTGRADTTVVNQCNAAKNGLRFGALGYLNTIWGDWGHWQPKATNDPGLVMGAAVSWGYENNKDLDIADALSRHVYDDPTGKLAAGIIELGRVEKDVADIETPNALNWSLVIPECPVVEGLVDRGWDKLGPFTPAMLDAVQQRLAHGLSLIADAQPACADAPAIGPELRAAAGLLSHAAKNIAARMAQGVGSSDKLDAPTRRELDAELEGLIQDFRKSWVARNREGGLADSTSRFERLRSLYQADTAT